MKVGTNEHGMLLHPKDNWRPGFHEAEMGVVVKCPAVFFRVWE